MASEVLAVRELRDAYERARELPEAEQRHIAALIEDELADLAWERSPELRADIEAARAEIAAGDYVTFEAYDRQRRERTHQRA